MSRSWAGGSDWRVFEILSSAVRFGPRSRPEGKGGRAVELSTRVEA
jgi:hypothetical protein